MENENSPAPVGRVDGRKGGARLGAALLSAAPYAALAAVGFGSIARITS